MVHRSRSEEERLYEHRNARQDAGHAIDALASVAVGVAEGDTLCDERIHVWGVAAVLTVLEGFVQGTDVFTSEALDDKDDNVFFSKARIVGMVHRAINGRHLLLILIVIGHHKDRFADGAIEREGRIQHQGSLDRTVYILIGIGDGDRSYSGGKASSDTCHHEGGEGNQREKYYEGIGPGTQTFPFQACLDIQFPYAPDEEGENDDEIPMMEGLCEEDRTEVSFV